MSHSRLFVLLGIGVLIVASLACNYTAPQGVGTPVALTRVVAMTDTPTLTATPTDTPTSTPTPTPTPTPLPAVRLERADRAMFNGDYDTALIEYTALISGSASTDEIRAAQFGAARAKLRTDDPSAADALSAFVNSFPGDAREPEAWFLLGQARMSANDYSGAIEAYRQYLKLRGDLVAAYVNQLIGDALRADKKPQDAIEAYRAALAAPSAIALDLREKLAGAFLDANDPSSALAQYDAILSVATFTSYRTRIQTLAIQALEAAGQTRQAHQRRLSIVDEYTSAAFNQLSCPYYSNYAYDALVTLVDAGVPVDEFQRGLVDYCAGQDDPALAAFTRAIQARNRVAESRYWAGLAFRSQGDTDNALRQFDLIIQNFSGSSVWGPAWLERGKTYALAKDFNAATNVYRELADKYPTRPEAPEALWRAGVAARSSGDMESAQSLWITLTDTFPASDWTAAAWMWQGKLALAQAQDITATLFFSRAAALDPTGYYGVRAAEWQRGDAAPLQPVSATLEMDEPAARAEAEVWLATRLSISDTTQLRGLRADVAATPALQRGRELAKLDLLAEADYEFDAVRTTYQSDALALYQLSLLFRDIRMYRQSIAAADAVIRLMRTSLTAAPPFLARLVYPTYYGDLVVPEAQARTLDPLLVFSVIRQESLFESLSFSTAAAHGLMQIIPATGQEIADALGWPNYSRTDLYKPYVSIKFGTYYLARQRSGLDGDLYAALAAYNGGPGNAVRWKATSGDDPDLFYETVSFSETRLYIRRITEYYEVYKRLYGVK